MRLFLAVLSALVLGGCAIPARADYLFDFEFGAFSLDAQHTYAASEVIYSGTTLGPTTLRYVSGSVDGYRPATVTVTEGTYRGLPGLPELMEYGTYGPGEAPDFGVNGFSTYIYAPAMVGVFPNYGATLFLTVPASYFGDPSWGVSDISLFDSTTLTITETPEPGSLMLLGTGVLGLVGVGRRRLGV